MNKLLDFINGNPKGVSAGEPEALQERRTVASGKNKVSGESGKAIKP